MRAYDAGRLALLATLWSLQFLFMRIAVPVFGSPLVAEARALFAVAFLVPWALIAAQRIAPLSHWRDHLGVALIVNLGPVELSGRTLLAAGAALLGAAFWGWAGVLIKQRFGRLPPFGLAAGSISFAALIMSPAWMLAPAPQAWTPAATGALLALGIVCSGIAYLPFFTLVRDIGPSRTLSVTFLVPVLGVFWGWLFLDEAVTLPMLAGAALVLGALSLVLRR